jgi:hypothetical protein
MRSFGVPKRKKQDNGEKLRTKELHDFYSTYCYWGDKMINDIFVNCNWVDTRWQQYSTHLHTNNTQNNTMKQNTHNGTYITIRIHKHNYKNT